MRKVRLTGVRKRAHGHVRRGRESVRPPFLKCAVSHYTTLHHGVRRVGPEHSERKLL